MASGADVGLWCIVTAGASTAVLVGVDGTPGWMAVRACVVIVATAAIATRWRGMAPGRRSLVALAVGIPAVAVAAGLVPLVLDGHGVVVRAGAVALAVSGAALVVIGLLHLAPGRSRSVRVAAAACGVVALVVVTVVVGPAVAATNVPPSHIGVTPDAVGLRHEDVVITTSDGVRLAGWYVTSRNGAAVVLLHGAGSTRSNVADHARLLARDGFGVLMIDARGHGGSGGRAMDFGWLGDADVRAAVDFLAARPDVTAGIGAVGVSMGGEEAIGASGSDGRLRAVVAEGATARVAGDEAWLSDEYGLRGWVQEQLESAQDWVVDVLTSAAPPRSLRASIAAAEDTRYLLITAGKVPDERRAALHMAGAASSRVEIWTVEAADHGGALEADAEAWAARVSAFLERTLIGTDTGSVG